MEELHLTHSSSMWSAGQAWEEAAALTLSLQGDQNAQHAPWDHVETLLSASAEEGASVNLRQAAVREILLYLNTSVWKRTLLSSDLLPSASLMCALFKDRFKFMFCRRCPSQQSWQKRDFCSPGDPESCVQSLLTFLSGTSEDELILCFQLTSLPPCGQINQFM